MGEVIDIATRRATIPFQPFKKIPRLNKQMIITEKIDGSNAIVHVTENGDILAGSRNRWITPEADNYGFAAWVQKNEAELLYLGPGTHYGEWYGAGIQRKYGLTEKRFALFNVDRWSDPAKRPECCDVVPVLARVADASNLSLVLQTVLSDLKAEGSRAVPGFMEPEGVVVYHTAAKQLFKVLLENDAIPKSLVAA